MTNNELMVLKSAYKLKEFTKPELCNHIGAKMKRPTVYFALGEVMKRKLVKEVMKTKTGTGNKYSPVKEEIYKDFVDKEMKRLLSVVG